MTALVVPCYNEALRLPTEAFLSWIRVQQDTHLILVDDGSRDSTLQLLEQLRHSCFDRISVLPLRPNRGKAEAVRAGILYAVDQFQPSVVGFWDADLATPLQTFDQLLAVLKERPDIEMIFGARVKLLGRHVERRAVRHYLGRIFATIASTVLNLPIYDTQCGAKLFRVKPHTRALFAQPFLSKWVFDVEIIARYLQLHGCDAEVVGHLIYEYPLESWVDIAGSKVRPADFFTSVWDLLRIHVRYLSNAGTR